MLERVKFFLERLSGWKVALLISIGVFVYGYSEKGWNNTYINGDGLGYYAYLPAVFVYHDLSFNFIETYEKKHYLPGQHADFRQEVPGGIVNRYYIGTAVMQSPFFLLAHTFCLLTGHDADGYSSVYQYAVLFAACFYLFIGLWALTGVLSFYSPNLISKVIPLIFTLGTPLLYYTVYNPDFSHIYSFAVVNLFVLTALHFFKTPSPANLILLFVWAGLITVIRPVNILIVVMMPFFAGGWNTFRAGFAYAFKRVGASALGMVAAGSIVAIQLWVYYYQTGHFWVYSYGQYGFKFLKPHFIDILFSYRKGLFLYTPVLFVSLAGFYFLFRRSRFMAIYLFLFLCLVTYILSSWDFWTYGMTYGQRPFIEYYALFSILMAFVLANVRRFAGYMMVGILGLLVVHNLIQMSQHRHYILHWDEMDKEKYWKVFLRTDPIYYGYLWGPPQKIMDNADGYKRAFLFAIPKNCASSASDTSEIVLQPGELLPEITFKPGLDKDSLDIVLSFKVFPAANKLKKNVLHIDVFRKSEPSVDGSSFEITLRNLDPLTWNKVRKAIRLKKHTSGEEFVIRMWNTGKYNFGVKEFEVLEKAANN